MYQIRTKRQRRYRYTRRGSRSPAMLREALMRRTLPQLLPTISCLGDGFVRSGGNRLLFGEQRDEFVGREHLPYPGGARDN